MLVVQSYTRTCKARLVLLVRSHGFQSLHKPTSTTGEQAPIKTESLIRKHAVSEDSKWGPIRKNYYKQNRQKEPFFSSNTASTTERSHPPRTRIEKNGAEQKLGLKKPTAPNGQSANPAWSEDSHKSKFESRSPKVPQQPPSSGVALDKAPHEQRAESVTPNGARDPKTPELTHFEELFPFEAAQERARKAQAQKAQAQMQAQAPQEQAMPDRRPLEFSHIDPTDPSPISLDDEDHSALTEPTSFSALPFTTQPSQRLALDPLIAVMLVLNTASLSLSDADFRRIAPKGKHIKEWTGPGELLKVFPGRDPRTLQQLPHYFLLFRNIEHATIYREHVMELHAKAKERTPTSVESPLTLPRLGPRLNPGIKGSSSSGGDEHGRGDAEPVEQEVEEDPSDPRSLLYNADDPVISALHDYALIPPSQTLHFSTLKPPFSASLARLLHNEGYASITRAGRDGEDRTGRAVLFYAEGCKEFSLDIIRHALKMDSKQRRMIWRCAIHNLRWGDGVTPSEQDEGEAELDDAGGDELQGTRGAGMNRWILTFEDKDEARRFVRRWHLRAFPMGQGEDDVSVSAEILW